jgi:hypothetical protein
VEENTRENFSPGPSESEPAKKWCNVLDMEAQHAGKRDNVRIVIMADSFVI